MITMRAAALGTLLVGAMAAFSSTSTFTGTVTGGLRADMHGDAKFGVVDGRGAAPSVFTLSLGATGSDGSVLFTRTSGVLLAPELPKPVVRPALGEQLPDAAVLDDATVIDEQHPVGFELASHMPDYPYS